MTPPPEHHTLWLPTLRLCAYAVGGVCAYAVGGAAQPRESSEPSQFSPRPEALLCWAGWPASPGVLLSFRSQLQDYRLRHGGCKFRRWCLQSHLPQTLKCFWGRVVPERSQDSLHLALSTLWWFPGLQAGATCLYPLSCVFTEC